MASAAGIIPVTGSAWKLALRKVRGSRGELLPPKDLAEAKYRMGSISNNALQKANKFERKYGGVGLPRGKELDLLPPEIVEQAKANKGIGNLVEIAFTKRVVNRKHELERGFLGVPGMAPPIPTEGQGSFHTHPLSNVLKKRSTVLPWSKGTLESTPSKADITANKEEDRYYRSVGAKHNILDTHGQTESVTHNRFRNTEVGRDIEPNRPIYFDRTFRKTRGSNPRSNIKQRVAFNAE